MLIHKQVIYSLRHPASNKHWLQARDITLIFKLQSSQAWLVYTEGSLHPLSSLSASKNASSVSNLIPAAEHCSSLHLTITGQGHSVCGCVTALLGRSFTWWTQLGLALSGSIRLRLDGVTSPANLDFVFHKVENITFTTQNKITTLLLNKTCFNRSQMFLIKLN